MSEQQISIAELQKKNEVMERQRAMDIKEMDELLEKNESLKKKITDLTDKYEHSLKEKDQKSVISRERELSEVNQLKDNLKDLEYRYRELEESHKDIQRQNASLKADLDYENSRRKEQELNFHSTRKTNEEKISIVNETLLNYEDVNQRLDHENNVLQDECKQLQRKISHIEEAKKIFEEEFKRKLDEIEKV